VLQRDGCIHKCLQSGSSDYDHCTNVGKAIRASQERGGLEAILRKHKQAAKESVNIKGMTKAEKTAYKTAKKKEERARKNVDAVDGIRRWN
jgi:hypothetical protein